MLRLVGLLGYSTLVLVSTYHSTDQSLNSMDLAQICIRVWDFVYYDWIRVYFPTSISERLQDNNLSWSLLCPPWSLLYDETASRSSRFLVAMCLMIVGITVLRVNFKAGDGILTPVYIFLVVLGFCGIERCETTPYFSCCHVYLLSLT